MPDGGDSPGDGELGIEQLHQLHRDADRQARGDDPIAVEMLAVIEAMSRRMLGVPAWLDTAPAAVVIMARVRARRPCAAIGDALGTALSIRVCGRDPELALPGVSAVSGALERARGHLADLGPGFDLGLDLDATSASPAA